MEKGGWGKKMTRWGGGVPASSPEGLARDHISLREGWWGEGTLPRGGDASSAGGGGRLSSRPSERDRRRDTSTTTAKENWGQNKKD